MKPLLAIIKKELKDYVDHPTAYILVIVFLVLNNFLFFKSALVQEVASLRTMFNLLPWIMMFFVSALTMRTWAEERREGTLNVLLSYPVKIWQVILGKYLATVIFLSAMLLLTLFIPFALTMAGDFDWGVIVGQYLGTIVMLLTMTAIGQWASSLTKNQVVSFIISIGVLFAFIIIGLEMVVLSMPYPLNVITQQLGLLSHFNSLTRGVVDARDILYFLSLGFVFLALSYAWLIRIKSRRGSKEWRTLQTSILVLVIIAVVINLFGQSFTVRADLTDQNLYSLSSATKRVLKDLDDTVRLTLYRSKKLPAQVELVSRDVQDILGDYQKFGGRHIDFSIKYPDDDEDAAAEAQKKGIPAIRFNVVREDEFTLQNGYLGLVIEYLDEYETLPFLKNINDLEYRLTRGILALQSDAKPRLGFVSDFGGKDLEELSTLSGALREQYIVENIKLASSGEAEEPEKVPEIDETIEILFISSPTQKYSESALTSVRNYIKKGGKIFWVVSGINVNQQALTVAVNKTGLEDILKENGITLNTDLVADLSSHETVNFSTGIFTYLLPYPFWVRANLQPHVLAGNIGQVMLPWASSLEISDKTSGSVDELIKTTNTGVRQKEGYVINPDQIPDFSTFDQAELILGVAMQDIPAEEGSSAGRWVVISNNDFLNDGMISQYPQNANLALNALDWLGQNEALLSIRSKNSQPSVLIWESDARQTFARWGNIAGIPVLVAAFGAIWIYRRRRRSKLSFKIVIK